MKIMVIGATGTIGRAVADALAERHEVVRVAHSRGDLRVDLGDPESVRRLFAESGPLDAVVCAAGAARFGPLAALTDDDFAFSLGNKLMGQVNVVREAVKIVRDGGSITVTTGVLAEEPMPGGAAISLVNAGLQGFVKSAALEMPRGLRVNAVSPPWVSETLSALGRDPAPGLPAAQVARAYVEAVEGTRSGQTLDARAFA